MYFLGQAGNFKAKDIWRHTFAFGTVRSLHNLRAHLAKRYQVAPEQIAFYHTGRTALATAIKATVPKNSKIAITSLTCYAVVQAVKAANCIPIFVDVNAQTLHYGAAELKATLKKYPDIAAVIVQNNLGIPVDITAIKRVAGQRVIIEDLAHCAGASYPSGQEVGTVGDATILSFGKGKSIDTISGGAVILRNPDLPHPKQPIKRPRCSDRLRARFYPLIGATIRGFYHLKLGRVFTSVMLKLHFIQRSADAPLDFTRRLTYWQAKLALRQLTNLPKNRPPIREFYLVEHRHRLLKELEYNGFIMYDIWYDCPVAPERYYKKVNFPNSECPVAVDLAQKLVNLPTHYGRAAMSPARKIIAKYAITSKIANKGAKNDH
ncbi:DegT/DnrJ/EryC1/StrS aminotransferase family protein [Candidatus Saccharibacteria bacterium]|nr:DegT/DnrJ/EryC1/StrS aminotransferase family protein [Candidatus Saccharibacteria bacterium]